MRAGPADFYDRTVEDYIVGGQYSVFDRDRGGDGFERNPVMFEIYLPLEQGRYVEQLKHLRQHRPVHDMSLVEAQFQRGNTTQGSKKRRRSVNRSVNGSGQRQRPLKWFLLRVDHRNEPLHGHSVDVQRGLDLDQFRRMDVGNDPSRKDALWCLSSHLLKRDLASAQPQVAGQCSEDEPAVLRLLDADGHLGMVGCGPPRSRSRI